MNLRVPLRVTEPLKTYDLIVLYPTAFSPPGGQDAHTRKKKKTYDLRKIGNYKKIPEMPGFDGKYAADHPKAKF